MTAVNSGNIPRELKERPQWVCWKYEKPSVKKPSEIKWTKIPYQNNGRKASSTNPATWTTYERALAAAEQQGYSGIGFVLTKEDPFVGVDLDHCVDAETGQVEQWARAHVDELDSYTEITPSNTGLRAFVKAELPPRGRKRGNFECYQTARFLTVTGNHLPGTPLTVENRQAEMTRIHQQVFKKETPRPTSSTAGLEGAALLDKARSAKHGDKFTRLWSGDTNGYPSHSEADLALCSYLAFWTDGDPVRIDTFYRRSGLYRDKWDEQHGAQTYGAMTISKALEGSTEHYAGHANGHRPGADTPPASKTLAEVVDVFQNWLHLPDPGIVYLVAGALVANRLYWDPTWVLFIGPVAGGKTEVVQSVAGLPHVHLASTLTEPSLLSGTPKKQSAPDSRGGLLRVIGDQGILLLKDFGSILSMHRDARASLLAALREVYDGSWTRHLGTDGGKTLSWTGKLGLLACCTPVVDTHHGAMAALGERFLNYRLPETDADRQARRALGNIGRERQMRTELSEAMCGLLASLQIPESPPELTDDAMGRLSDLATLAVRCRSVVERDPYRREIELIPEPEAPGRIAQALARLYLGLRLIGTPEAAVWPLISKVALDCMPSIRRKVLDVLLGHADAVDTTTIATEAGYPTPTTRRVLEDLTAHRVVERQTAGSGRADQWLVETWAQTRLEAILSTFSDLSGGAQS
ncbi:MAG: hypothetical protein QGI50_09710 [Dehalococcoidia bacterium]|nr:hypothetical protein [Dehalococcoidia bacterium]